MVKFKYTNNTKKQKPFEESLTNNLIFLNKMCLSSAISSKKSTKMTKENKPFLTMLIADI